MLRDSSVGDRREPVSLALSSGGIRIPPLPQLHEVLERVSGRERRNSRSRHQAAWRESQLSACKRVHQPRSQGKSVPHSAIGPRQACVRASAVALVLLRLLLSIRRSASADHLLSCVSLLPLLLSSCPLLPSRLFDDTHLPAYCVGSAGLLFPSSRDPIGEAVRAAVSQAGAGWRAQWPPWLPLLRLPVAAPVVAVAPVSWTSGSS